MSNMIFSVVSKHFLFKQEFLKLNLTNFVLKNHASTNFALSNSSLAYPKLIINHHGAKLSGAINNEMKDFVKLIRNKLESNSPVLLDINRLCQVGYESDYFVYGSSMLLMSKVLKSSVADISHYFEIAKLIELVRIHNSLHFKIYDHMSASNNKLYTILGDALYARIFSMLAAFKQPQLMNIVMKIFCEKSDGFFMLEQEAVNVMSNKIEKLQPSLNVEYWMVKNFLLHSSLFAKGFQCVLKLLPKNDIMREPKFNFIVYDFGRNLGLYLIAFKEIQSFKQINNNRILHQLNHLSLPVIMYCSKMDQSAILNFFKSYKYGEQGIVLNEIMNGDALDKAEKYLKIFQTNSLVALNKLHLHEESKNWFKGVLGVN